MHFILKLTFWVPLIFAFLIIISNVFERMKEFFGGR
jgi:hypothetical protein